MSVEKLSSASRLIHEKKPFTQVLNHVIHNIKDGDSFLVWCYLESKSENWKVVKQDIKNLYGFSDKKIKKIFSYLRRANLIKYVQSRCANGDFAQVDIHVLSGFEFDKTQSYIECARGGSKMAPPINGPTANDELLNKEITKEREEHNKDNICATEVARETMFISSDTPASQDKQVSDDNFVPEDNGFDKFWDIYPVKKNKIRAKKVWERKKLNKIASIICNDVRHRKTNEIAWSDDQYIPHPSTYLQNELWTDEITPSPNRKGIAYQSTRKQEEEHQKQKQEQYKQDGQAFRDISRAVLSPIGKKAIGGILKKLNGGKNEWIE